MLKENIFTYLFLFLGIGFVAIGILLTKSYQKQLPSLKVIAHIERLTGEVSVTKKFKTKKKPINETTGLNSLDTVETNEEGKADIDFPTTEKIRLLGNTKIVIDEEGPKQVLILHKGDLEVQSFGVDNRVLISSQGQRVFLREWESFKKNKVVSHEDRQKSLNSYQSTQKLTETYVTDTIQTHKIKFLQCFSKLLQKTPGVSGSVTLSFTIEKSGKVSNSNIASSQLTDIDFKVCLHEVLKRIEFKAFEGEPISTVIPLNFE